MLSQHVNGFTRYYIFIYLCNILAVWAYCLALSTLIDFQLNRV